MEHLRKLVLLAVVVAVLPTQVLPQPSPSYEKALSAGIYFYNQVPGRENAFRVWQVHSPPPGQPPQEQTQRLLRFTLRETVCPVTEELLLDQCDFKTDGLVKECLGSVSNDEGIAAIIFTCDSVAPEPLRFKRRSCLKNRTCSFSSIVKHFGYRPFVGK